MNTNIALLVVLYQDLPPKYVHDNSNIPIIIIDNTPKRDLRINEEHITYIPLNDNLGIAEALNIGFHKANEFGTQWVVTMDQDSILPEDMINKYTSFIMKHTNEKIGILSPLIKMYDGEQLVTIDSHDEIEQAITSGCMISMQSFKDVKGFKSELFIDGVDFEYCYHIKQFGYKIFRLNNILMQHHLGNTKEYKLFGKHLFYITNHNCIRRYYMTRNSLYINKLYFPNKCRNLFRELIPYFKILLFEEDKYKKLKAIKLGRQDFKDNKFGKLEHIL